MLRLKKYLKPFLIGVFGVILLLGFQVVCDLNLPNYMSDIVNVGIQQNGIESGVPSGISQNGYALMRTFMSEDEQVLLDANYTLKSGSDKTAKGKTYSSLYPKVGENDKLYVLNDAVNEETVAALETAYGTSTWTMVYVMKDMQEKSGGASVMPSGETNENGMMDLSSFDITKLYDMLPMLSKLPPAMLDDARLKVQAMDSSLLPQSATMLAGAFYSELGLDVATIQSRYILRIGAIMLLVALASGIATILVSLISSRIAAGVARNLRNDIFKKVENFSNAEFDHFSTASLITRSTNDVTQIQMLIAMGMRMICYAPLMAIGGTVMALRKSVSMGWIIAAACALLIGVVMVIFAIVLPKFKKMQQLIDRLNLVARETLTGLMVIRAFGTREFEEKRFDKANEDLTGNTLFVNRVMTFMMPIIMLIMNCVSLLIIWVGAHKVAESAMQVGDMMAFMQYAMQIIMSFMMISMMFIFLPRAAVSADRIADVLETKPTIKDPKEPKPIVPERRGYVEFKNVCFKYEGAEENALDNISFVAAPGETVGFIGATGSGKTTLVNLIPRFYDATEGEVLVGGVNVKDQTQHDLRAQIGYVPQKSILMSGTIKSNITYGNDEATEADVKEAAEIAQSLEFIDQKPEKYESEIAQGGSNVSGGQRQRLSIARALAVKPDVFIFDDSFSALDFKTDAALRKALKQHTQHATVIIIAQRVSTIMNANMIYVIDDGKIISRGTHRELLKSCPEYMEIAASQLSKEEIENEQ